MLAINSILLTPPLVAAAALARSLFNYGGGKTPTTSPQQPACRRTLCASTLMVAVMCRLVLCVGRCYIVCAGRCYAPVGVMCRLVLCAGWCYVPVGVMRPLALCAGRCYAPVGVMYWSVLCVGRCCALVGACPAATDGLPAVRRSNATATSRRLL